MDRSPVRRGAHSVSRGRHFERVAERYLLARGFEPIARNVRFGHGEIDLVMNLVESNRLVTVTGPGGIGKTRLAVEAAQRMQSQFADGAVFVAITPLALPGTVRL